MKEKLNYFTAIKYLSGYIGSYKKNFIKFYFGWLFDTVLSIAMPILFGIMIDEIVYYQNLNTFIKVSLVFVVMSIFSCLLYFLIYAQHHYLMSMYTFRIKNDIFDHLQKCDAQYLSGVSTGDIISTIQWYSNECMHFVIRNIIHSINCVLCIMVLICYLFLINWQIGLFTLIAAPVSVYINTKFGKKIRELGDQQRENYNGYISWTYEILSGLRDIRMLGAKKKVNRNFKERSKEMFRLGYRSEVSTLTATNLISFTNLAVRLAIFTFAGYLALNGNITIGLLTIVMTFYGHLTQRIEDFSTYYLSGQERVSYIQHIYDFMHSPTEDSWPGKDELRVIEGRIKFHDITFSYEKGGEVLQGFQLDIRPGKRTALVGKSGCGKTTLAYMLIGFYKPQKGWIEIDGQRISDCSLKSIRKNIGLIQQDVLLFDGTIRQNILLGNKKATEEELCTACVQAGLWDVIESLPHGLDTEIGTGGTDLSGGQKQRIAIARIYLKDPRIIIFDEATSALDDETEKNIHEAWDKALAGRTAIMIAHRQNSVMFCDRAAIIKEGKTDAAGSPEELLKENRDFQKLFAVKGDSYVS